MGEADVGDGVRVMELLQLGQGGGSGGVMAAGLVGEVVRVEDVYVGVPGGRGNRLFGVLLHKLSIEPTCRG